MKTDGAARASVDGVVCHVGKSSNRHPALFVVHPEWHAAFDTDRQLAETNRRKVFDRVIADKVTVAGYHFGMPGAGTIKKDGKGYAFVPVRA